MFLPQIGKGDARKPKFNIFVGGLECTDEIYEDVDEEYAINRDLEVV